MKITNFGEVILDPQDVFNGLYSGKLDSADNIFLDDSQENRNFLAAGKENFEKIEKYKIFSDLPITQAEFDASNQSQWYMPEEYRTYDIIDWLYCECRTVEEKTRVTEELRLFAQHNMITMLKYIKYLIDTMRKNNIVWGVGRGSSVASYVLYLIGVHKIDSIKYGLNINEFLKGEEDGKI
jgi:DNA polymerase III alpha subunit